MQAEPPFAVEHISSHPVVSGHEWRNPLAKRCKANVMIPYGCVKQGEHALLLSVGINDCCCAIARLSEKQLRL